MAPHTVYSAFVNYHMFLGLETACFLCVTRFYDLDLCVMEQIPEMHSFSNEIHFIPLFIFDNFESIWPLLERGLFSTL